MPSGIYKRTKKHMEQIYKNLVYRDRKISEETARKISEANRGNYIMTPKRKECIYKNLVNKNRALSEQTKEKISQSRFKRKKKLGYINSPSARKNMSKSHKGVKYSEFRNKQCSERAKRQWQDTEFVRKQREAHKGYTLTEEHKRKIGIANKGEKSGNWLGGKSFESYGKDWTEDMLMEEVDRSFYTIFMLLDQLKRG